MKNTTKFLGIVILAAASFAMLACPTDGGDGGGGGFLATLKAPDVKSVYLSDIPVKGGGRAAAGGDTISSLSYVSDTGQNVPALFSTRSGKKYVFEVTSLEQLDERCIIIGIDGFYEVTSTGAAGSYTVGPLVETYYDNGYWNDATQTWVETPLHSVLIDMKNSKLYNFSEFKQWWNNSEGPVRFMEGNIIYTIKRDNNDGTVYKIDLSSASAGSALQAVPLNHSSFMSINSITLPYTINNKLIGNKRWYFNTSDNISLDVSGTKGPEEFKYPADTLVSYDYQWYFFKTNVLIRDLTDKPWAFIKHNNSKRDYSIAEVGIDDSGLCTLSELKKYELAFDTPQYSSDYFKDNPIYTFNAARTGRSIFQGDKNSNDYDTEVMKSYLNNGVVTLYPNGFVRLRQEVDGIKVESVELTTLPTGIGGKSVISSDDYLFYLEGKSIKRLKLAAGSSPQVVYSHSGIMDIVTTRDLLTASGRKLIFYQYATSTEVHTYSLDMYKPTAVPELLATNDAEVRSIVELDF